MKLNLKIEFNELKKLAERLDTHLCMIAMDLPTNDQAIAGGIKDVSYMTNNGLVESYQGECTISTSIGKWLCQGKRPIGSPSWVTVQGRIDFTLQGESEFAGISNYDLLSIKTKIDSLIEDYKQPQPSYNLAILWGVKNLSSKPIDKLGNVEYASYHGTSYVTMANGDVWHCKGYKGYIEFYEPKVISLRMNLPNPTEWKGDFDILSPYPPYNTGNYFVRVKSETLYIKDFCGYSSNPFRDESSEVTIPKGIWEIIEEKGTPLLKRKTIFKEIVV